VFFTDRIVIVLNGMGGIAPKITPELLPANLAQSASNAVLHKGGVAPLKAGSAVATPTKSGIKKSIYRFGKSQPETKYWFAWTDDVHVCRGPVVETTERTYYSGDGAPKKTDMTLALSGGTSYPLASYTLGVPAPATAPVLSAYSASGPSVTEERAYVYTYVTGWGEESAPSPAEIGTANSSALLRVSGFENVPTGSHNITARRIYRTVTSSSGTNYYFIAELALATSSFNDDVDVAAIGEPLATLDWDTPPDDLHGLIALPSGALCGMSGKQVCFSVVGAPYAWPAKYRLTCDYDPVAVEASGQGVYVLTTGNPYFINTGDPESAQMIRIDEEQPCIAPRSVVAFQGEVIYAAPDGLVSLSQSGSKVVTEKIFDRETWQVMTPTDMFAAKHDGRYYGFWAGGGGFTLDTDGNFIPHDIDATAVYVDPVLDMLYMAVGTTIQKWNSGTALTSSWRSKRHAMQKPTSFSCYQVKANSYDDLTIKLTATLASAAQATAIASASSGKWVASGSTVTYTAKVAGRGIYRLPAGFKSYLWDVEVTGTDHWTFAAVASSVAELKSV